MAAARTHLAVLQWLQEPSSRAGVHFLSDDWTWRRVSYRELAGRVASMAEHLQQQGLAGRRVALFATSDEDFAIRFFAVLATGGTCVPVPPSRPLEDHSKYRRRVLTMLRAANPAVVVASGVPVEKFTEFPRVILPPVRQLGMGGALEEVSTNAPALVQFSSGASGPQKGVRISRPALEANLAATRKWLDVRPGDRTASWVPLFHDLGLVGTFLGAVVPQMDLMLMSSVQFLRRPEVWLRCFGELGCTLSAAPAFGYVHVARKVARASLDGCDFSRWRVAIIGAEPIRAEDLDDFVEAFGPLGFQRRAFCPAYGLAEATLVVTGNPPDQEPVLLREEWLRPVPPPTGERAEADTTRIAHPRIGPTRMVGSGVPVEHARVSVRDPLGEPVPEGALGEIWISGPSLADGYEPEVDRGFRDGWFTTGDVGCVHGDELFIFGRLSDSFQVRGEIILAEQAERRISAAFPQLGSLVVVPSRAEGGGMTVVVESNRPLGSEEADATRMGIRGLFGGNEVDLIFVRRGNVPRTTSGKPMRRQCWQQYVAAGAADSRATG